MTYRLNTDYDGDLCLHSDDVDSDLWVVEALWPRKDAFEPCDRHPGGYISVTGSSSRNGWYVDGCVKFRITDGAGNSKEHNMHSYPAIRSGEWDWPNTSPKRD